MRMIELLTTGRDDAHVHVLLAHGAGAPMTSPFMELTAALLVAEGLLVSRFEFGYMAKRRLTGKRTPPPKAERLIEEFKVAVELARDTCPSHRAFVVGGKSMGGRVASLAAQDLYERGRMNGLICLGYPFHPPGKPEQLRTAHLAALEAPTLIVQGERDPFGSREDVEILQRNALLSPKIDVWWAPDGDHDLGPRGNSGFTRKGNLSAAIIAVGHFCNRIAVSEVGYGA